MKDSIFLKSGNLWKLSSEEDFNIHKKLPGGVYTLISIPMQGFFLQKTTDFEHKGKIYGDSLVTRDRIWNTFMDRKGSTGVLLYGEKGSGKTLLTKLISQKAQEMDFATVIINSPFTGEAFNALIQSLPDNTVVIFDEFEKVYSKEEFQDPILSLLDGLYNSKKLFLFSINEVHKVNRYMLNRPGRIFYKLKFDGLSREFIREYCQEKLNNKNNINEVVSIVDYISKVNFDMLQAIVEEMNRYDEKVSNSLQYLNIEADRGQQTYKILEFISKKHNVHKSCAHIGSQIAVNLYDPNCFNGFWFTSDEDVNPDVPHVDDPPDLEYDDDGNLTSETKIIEPKLKKYQYYFSFRTKDFKSKNDEGIFIFENEYGIVKVRRHYGSISTSWFAF